MIRIYEVTTEDVDTFGIYDRFNVAANSFEKAVEKANKKLAKDWRHVEANEISEKIQSIKLIASEG